MKILQYVEKAAIDKVDLIINKNSIGPHNKDPVQNKDRCTANHPTLTFSGLLLFKKGALNREKYLNNSQWESIRNSNSYRITCFNSNNGPPPRHLKQSLKNKLSKPKCLNIPKSKSASPFRLKFLQFLELDKSETIKSDLKIHRCNK
jgi:hypothetical protein